MPKSRNDRKSRKAVYTPPPKTDAPKVSPKWLVPTMLGCGIVGILWLAVYYVTAGQLPLMMELGPWNLAVGFSFFIVAVALSTRWH